MASARQSTEVTMKHEQQPRALEVLEAVQPSIDIR
jgi:hypothetical protein